MSSRKNTKVTSTTRSTTATEDDQHLPPQEEQLTDELELLQSMKSKDLYVLKISGLKPNKKGTRAARRSTIVESIDPREASRSLASMREEARRTTVEMSTDGEQQLQGEAEFITLDNALFKCLIENSSNINDSTARFMVDPKKAATITTFQKKAATYHRKLQTDGSGNYGVGEIGWWITRRTLKANEGDPRDHLNFGWPSSFKNPMNKETGYVMVYVWMQKDLCLEALLFYNTAKELREKYTKSIKKLKRNPNGLDLDTMNEKAAKFLQTFKRGYIALCREYVRPNSPMEINISGATRKKYVDLAMSHCGMAPDHPPVTEAPRNPDRRVPASLQGITAAKEKKARSRARNVRERTQSVPTTDEVVPPSGRIGRSQSEDGGKKKKGKKNKKNKTQGESAVFEDTNQD